MPLRFENLRAPGNHLQCASEGRDDDEIEAVTFLPDVLAQCLDLPHSFVRKRRVEERQALGGLACPQ